jgi:SAM-dependent methyltransferase
MIQIRRVINCLYHSPIVARVFHTLVYCLQRELRDCQSVLDLGCGPDSPLQFCRVQYSVGVDVFLPYLRSSAARGIHTAYIQGDISQLLFRPKSFDAVVMIDVLEHLSEEEGHALLRKAECWARKRVIVTTPNGYLPQGARGGNPYQAHRSGWSLATMRRLGYRAYGLAGLRFLHRENPLTPMEDPAAMFTTIRWRPWLFWLCICALTETVAYYVPQWSFEIFYVRETSPTLQ